MDYRRGNGPFQGYQMPHSSIPQPPSQRHAIVPYGSSALQGYPYQPNQYLGSETLGPPQMQAPGSRFVNPQFNPMQDQPPAMVGNAERARFSRRTIGAPMPNRFARQTELEIIAPQTQRVARGRFEDLLKSETQGQGNAAQVPATVKSIDTVALPSEMSIGSLAHVHLPPTSGVVKIANIPYSITKQEIVQFLGRQARLIPSNKGCPVHIIMERSTAKTMDCYVELETPNDAKEIVDRINRIYETGRAPRLGNRHVDVEVSSQDALLKDLFPRAKCIVWEDGVPIAVPNIDPYSTGFMGFFTSEEIIGAIRHAEMPHRSPFCAKCPQRTYESTISTMYKFPWFATKLYTVNDRNLLFEMVNRHVQSLASRIKRSNTVGLGQPLLRDLLYAGLNCPAFNERQKYTLCINSDEITEILKFPNMGKWFPFDALVKLPDVNENTHLYYANLISKGTNRGHENSSQLPNMFPTSNFDLQSPYGPIWFEWPIETAKIITWDQAVQHEMVILCDLVLSGWIQNEKSNALKLGSASGSSSTGSRNLTISPTISEHSEVSEDSIFRAGIFATPSRRASESYKSVFSNCSEDSWSQKIGLRPSNRAKKGYLGHHRNTLSSPMCLGTLKDSLNDF